MEYGIRELSEMAGVSARTLRYYDEIGLLKSLYVSDAGYRFYGETEVAMLQQILFYRERGFGLKQIRQILYREDFDIRNALEEHLSELLRQREHVESLIRTVEQTIRQVKGECKMSNAERFRAFKERIVHENEEKYGSEIREKYGNDEVDAANKKMLDMSEADYERFKNLGEEIQSLLEDGVATGVKPDSEEAKRIAGLHKEWLCMTWKKYTKEMHQGVASMYVCDERFTGHYDAKVAGCAKLLEQAVCFWVDKI